MIYRSTASSGLSFPALSLGLWHNFGLPDSENESRDMVLYAFESGITHFDLANNYGPPPGEAERRFGKILQSDLHSHRDEILISTKAGYACWEGPYGDGGSRKYLTSSLHRSLKHLGVDYVDIYYHHRPDPNTPLEETLLALSDLVKQGKALYIGLSNYPPQLTLKALTFLKNLQTPCLIHQPSYNMLDRHIEEGLTDVLRQTELACAVYVPLAQGLLTGAYLQDIPLQSRAAKPHGFLQADRITPELRIVLNQLNQLALNRGQSLSQMALQWVLRDPVVTTALVGTSKLKQLKENLECLNFSPLDSQELIQIDQILKGLVVPFK